MFFELLSVDFEISEVDLLPLFHSYVLHAFQMLAEGCECRPSGGRHMDVVAIVDKFHIQFVGFLAHVGILVPHHFDEVGFELFRVLLDVGLWIGSELPNIGLV